MQAHVRKQIEKMRKVMIGEIDCGIPSLLKMLPRKQFNYHHFMHKIEDVQKMVGCNGMDGAVVCNGSASSVMLMGGGKRGECLVSSFISG